MKRLIAIIVSVGALMAGLLLAAASPATAHCVQTPAGWADLAPGHFAAAGGHTEAIAHSGGVVGGPCPETGEELNVTAPDENPPLGVP
jgi:hypothetical protein